MIGIFDIYITPFPPFLASNMGGLNVQRCKKPSWYNCESHTHNIHTIYTQYIHIYVYMLSNLKKPI